MVRVRHFEVLIDIYTINISVFGTRNNMTEERQYLRCSLAELAYVISFLFTNASRRMAA